MSAYARAACRSNVTLQDRQQKYTRPAAVSERCSAAATSTLIPQIGSIAVCAAGVSTARLGLAVRRCWMISARMLTAISFGLTAPMSRPAGALSRARRSRGRVAPA